MIEVDNPDRFINPRSTFGDATFLGGSKFTTNVVPLWNKSEEAEIFTRLFRETHITDPDNSGSSRMLFFHFQVGSFTNVSPTTPTPS
jgi:hypothetical protein